MNRKNIVLAGATGLVGGHLLRILRAEAGGEKPDGSRLFVPVRRLPPGESSRSAGCVFMVADNILSPVSEMGDLSGGAFFCALGTTIARAGSRVNFEKVDFHLVLDMTRALARQGITQVYLVSAIGAAPGSLFFYNRVKGRLEEELKMLDLEALHIFQPSLLLGDREESRLAEGAAQKLLGPVGSLMGAVGLSRYRPISGEQLALAMVSVWKKQVDGVHVHLGADLF